MIFCKELDKTFATKDEMFAALKAAKGEIIALKKADIKKSDPVTFTLPKGVTAKGEGTAPAELKLGDTIYPVINSCLILDSHGDVHLIGIWDKSADQQKGKVYYCINHELEIGKIISYPGDVELLIENKTWAELGQDYEGETQVLMFGAKLTDKTNNDAFLAFKSNEAIQNSIRMQYVDVKLAVNSNNPDYAEEKALFDLIVPTIANKEDAILQGYFWAIAEAKIYKEGSAVLFGSNPATPVLRTKNIQPPASTEEKNAPLSSTQTVTTFINPNMY